VVAGGTVTPDGSPSYGETVAATGSLGTLRGPEIVPMLVGLMRE
jgi:2,3-bisphosphoglycerate-independent phosphoglycerate mutase